MFTLEEKLQAWELQNFRRLKFAVGEVVNAVAFALYLALKLSFVAFRIAASKPALTETVAPGVDKPVKDRFNHDLF